MPSETDKFWWIIEVLHNSSKPPEKTGRFFYIFSTRKNLISTYSETIVKYHADKKEDITKWKEAGSCSVRVRTRLNLAGRQWAVHNKRLELLLYDKTIEQINMIEYIASIV